jgi:hypothetical protein
LKSGTRSLNSPKFRKGGNSTFRKLRKAITFFHEILDESDRFYLFMYLLELVDENEEEETVEC